MLAHVTDSLTHDAGVSVPSHTWAMMAMRAACLTAVLFPPMLGPVISCTRQPSPLSSMSLGTIWPLETTSSTGCRAAMSLSCGGSSSPTNSGRTYLHCWQDGDTQQTMSTIMHTTMRIWASEKLCNKLSRQLWICQHTRPAVR